MCLSLSLTSVCSLSRLQLARCSCIGQLGRLSRSLKAMCLCLGHWVKACASLPRSMKILIDEGATVDFFTDDNVDENSKALGYLTMEPLNLAIENNHVNCLR